MQYVAGTKIMRKVQFKWNWRIGMKSIRYGCKYLVREKVYREYTDLSLKSRLQKCTSSSNNLGSFRILAFLNCWKKG